MRARERLVLIGIIALVTVIMFALNLVGPGIILLLLFMALSGIIVAWYIFLISLLGLGILFLIIISPIPGGTAYWPTVPILATIITIYEMYRVGKNPPGIFLSKKDSKRDERARKYAEDVLKEAKKEKDKSKGSYTDAAIKPGHTAH